jgi:hypothetical protein
MFLIVFPIVFPGPVYAAQTSPGLDGHPAHVVAGRKPFLGAARGSATDRRRGVRTLRPGNPAPLRTATRRRGPEASRKLRVV